MLQTISKWLSDNAASIIAGVISSLIVLSLQFLVDLAVQFSHDFITQRSQVRRLFGLRSPRRIYVVSGNVEQLATDVFRGTVLLAAPDAEAATKIKLTLAVLYPDADIIHTFSSTMSEELFSEDIVSVGGPVNNATTRMLLQEMTSKVSFENLDIVTGKARYSLEKNNQGRLITDHGLLFVGPNPFNPDKRCMVVAGCDTNGVLAAAECLQLGHGRARIMKRLKTSLSYKVRRHPSLYLILRTRTVGNLPGDPMPIEVGNI